MPPRKGAAVRSGRSFFSLFCFLAYRDDVVAGADRRGGRAADRLVVIVIVLDAVNLTGPQVELIAGAMLAIDRPLDMCRTVVNVFSDSCGAAIIARSEGEKEADTVVVRG